MKLFFKRLPKGEVLTLLLVFMFALLNVTTFAQNVVKGIVTSAAGKPLEGVTISAKGKNMATVTAADGSFSMNVPRGTTLNVSYVGYESEFC